MTYQVRHLDLVHNGEPIVEYDPKNEDGQHVVTLFKGCECFRNVWDEDEIDPETLRFIRYSCGVAEP